MNLNLVSLLHSIGSPFLSDTQNNSVTYTKKAFTLAEKNKIPLTYLNKLQNEICRKLPEFYYHSVRFKRLLEIVKKITEIFNKEGVNYVIFKTLRPYPEYVSDIDVLSLGSHQNYQKIMAILKLHNYLFMEKGAYCTTFKDFKTNFETEVMIDIYDEISVSRLIYIDKNNLKDYVVKKDLEYCTTNVLNIEAELLVLIAHSSIKENKYIIAEYYSTLIYLSKMDALSIKRFINLVKVNRLNNAARWHLTITLLLHKFAYGISPKKLVDLLFELGGTWPIDEFIINNSPPFGITPSTLARIFFEKLPEPIFRRSIADQLCKPLNRSTALRILEHFDIII